LGWFSEAGCAQVSPKTGSPAAKEPPPLIERTEDGFRVPQPQPTFQFPKDHGSHPEFKIEWWYLTGHLFGPAKERFGYQVTFFRRAGAPRNPGSPIPPRTPLGQEFAQNERFGSNEIYLLHVALLDLRTGKFLHQERLVRTGWEAASSSEGLDVKVSDSSLRMPEPATERFALEAYLRDKASLTLSLEPVKPLVVFGKDGVSRKGNSNTAASWYLTFPRLRTEGEIQLNGVRIPVHGETWMDHEISSSQLTGEQSGWDWAGIQLADGREIMTYRLRHKDGSTDPASALTWVSASGQTTQFGADQFQWKGRGIWTSPNTEARYPLPVVLSCPDPETGNPVELTLEPLALNQELGGKQNGLAYWEGACRVLKAGKEIGSAYVELTGYSGDLSQRLK
jgi:predicted secreted hydrolase